MANTPIDSTRWFNDQVTRIGEIKEDTDTQSGVLSTFRKVGTFNIGKMYIFAYDPKHKATLPFYDAFPLVIPIDIARDGFLGLNLHYLPPNARASIMKSLQSIKNNDKYDDSTKMLVSYQLLKQSATRFAGFQNCIKHYLLGHIKSNFRIIDSKDWDKVVMLPLQRWKINPDKRYASKSAPPY